MTSKEAHLLKPLVAIFKSEAAEHIRAMAAGLHELSAISERAQQGPVVEAIFREAHSLKGAAWIVNQTEIQALCHTLESVFATWKNQQKQPTPELLTLLNHAVAGLEHFLKTVGTERAPAEASRLTRYIHQIESLSLEDASTDPPSSADTESPLAVGASVRRAPAGKSGLPEERFAFSDTV
ncbi:MAG: Hpt domain-containing protein, partial [Caldilineaceae bacterium]|nr:Hpt domain-containing protein [Caldilineaceae bacterium]